MDLPAGLAVAVGILVLLPLAALAVERRWHDPPRERWGIPAERLAAARNSPELVAYRRRIALGLDPRKAAVVDRAVQTGTAAPPELRAAAQEMARLRIEELDRRRPVRRTVFALWLAIALLFLVLGVYLAVRRGAWYLLVYSVWPLTRMFLVSPWLVRRERGRAEAAVVANGS